MKIEKNIFKNAINRISGSVQKKGVIPILSNVLINCEDNLMTITSNDLNNVCSVKIPIKDNLGNVSFTANFEQLKKVGMLRGKEIQINYSNEDNKEKIVVNDEKTTIELSCLPVEDFPTLKEENFITQINMCVKDLIESLNKVKNAADDGVGSRKALTGIYIEVKNNEAIFTATNGKRICLVKTNVCSFGNSGFNCLLTNKCVENLKNLDCSVSKDENGNEVEPIVKIKLFEQMITFEQEDFCVTSKIMKENYPFEQVYDMTMNKFTCNSVSLLKANELSESMKIVSNFLNEEKICFDFKDNELIIHGSNDNENVKDSVSIEKNSQDNFSMMFNNKFLIDNLQYFQDETIKIETNGSVSPFRVHDENYYILIMPMKQYN